MQFKVSAQHILFTSFVAFGFLMLISPTFAIPSTAALLAYCTQAYLNKNKDRELDVIKERLSQLEKKVAFGGQGRGV